MLMRLALILSFLSLSLTSYGAKMEFKNYVLKNKNGTEVDVTNYGGIITKILTKDKTGKLADITLGFDRAEDYEKHKEHPYFGALIGRYGNRIAKGKFTLDGKEYKLAVNNGPNALHGGIKGFDKVFWNVKQDGNKLTLNYTSKDGEEGYPGNLKVTVTYELTDKDELKINYLAETDKATPLNLTQHTYFNLSADKNQTILNHQIMINGDEITEVDSDLTPTGKLVPVKGTVMDLTKPTTIGDGIGKVKEGGGYDHNWVLRGKAGELKEAATLYDPSSGRFMEVWTTEPGLQFYSGNFLDGKLTGKNGDAYVKNDGLCLETQHFPDSPNHPNFPSTILRPGNKYTSTTVYKFAVK
ncbi:MAG: aldose epimerase family protein [Bacteriovoracaceae bacterium]